MELRARQNYLPNRELRSIYFGGGTPSQLTLSEIGQILDCVSQLYHIRSDAELTLEANPDDITPTFARGLLALGFNRVSLGVQTFDDHLLSLIRRRHTAEEARRAVRVLANCGINNVSIDLIYGLPQQSLQMFKHDLHEALSLPIKHLSSYSLMVEEGTPLYRLVNSGQLTPADDELCLSEYELLLNRAHAAGFEHYEISNFALPDFYSRHNSSYWNGTPYLGCGPGAHSYDGVNRWRNLPNLEAYLRSPANPPHEVEVLSRDEKFDEMVFTALRTSEGLTLSRVEEVYGTDVLAQMLSSAAPHLRAGRLECDGKTLRITRQGLFVSDDIMSDLMRA